MGSQLAFLVITSAFPRHNSCTSGRFCVSQWILELNPDYVHSECCSWSLSLSSVLMISLDKRRRKKPLNPKEFLSTSEEFMMKYQTVLNMSSDDTVPTSACLSPPLLANSIWVLFETKSVLGFSLTAIRRPFQKTC